jgi:hypothetical protein
MNCVVLRKAIYKLSGTSRLVWAVVLAEREGLTLLFVRKPDEKRTHALTVAVENVRERLYEDAPNASRFHLESEDVAEIGARLQAVGEHLSSEEFQRQFFPSGDEWWQE